MESIFCIYAYTAYMQCIINIKYSVHFSLYINFKNIIN